jgi:hypothetical protein
MGDPPIGQTLLHLTMNDLRLLRARRLASAAVAPRTALRRGLRHKLRAEPDQSARTSRRWVLT